MFLPSVSSAESHGLPADLLILFSFLLLARVRYRSGNPLAHIARRGYLEFEARGKSLIRHLAFALLSGLPDHDGIHKQYSLRQVFSLFLYAHLRQDVGSVERAFEVREREYLKRIGKPIEHKENPDGDTILKRLKDLLPWREYRDYVKAFLRGSILFVKQHTRHLDGGFDVSFDGHKIPVYPRKKRQKRRMKQWSLQGEERREYELDDYRRDAIGAHEFRGTKQALAYATLQTTSPHRYTLAYEALVDHLNHFHRALRACLHEMGEVLGLRARILFIDREGSTGKVASVLREAIEKAWIRFFLVAARRDARIKRALAEVPWQDVPYRVGCEYKILPDQDMGGGLRATLVAVRRLVDKRGKRRHVNDPMKDLRTFLFWTNMDVTPNNVYELSELYRKRWGIETGYREDRHAFPHTKTESRKLRRLTYAVSLVALNLRTALNDAHLKRDLVEIPRNRAVSLARAKEVLLRALEQGLEDTLGTD